MYYECIYVPGIKCEVRQLKLGDFTWIARCKRTGAEYILDVIIERKRISDLVSSIKDGRLREQRTRLMACGIRHVCFLVEGDIRTADNSRGGGSNYFANRAGGHGYGGHGGHGSGEGGKSMRTAVDTSLATLNSVFGYQVQRTHTLGKSVEFLISLDQLIHQRYDSDPAACAKLSQLCQESQEYFTNSDPSQGLQSERDRLKAAGPAALARSYSGVGSAARLSAYTGLNSSNSGGNGGDGGIGDYQGVSLNAGEDRGVKMSKNGQHQLPVRSP